jgi:hypothetical protein
MEQQIRELKLENAQIAQADVMDVLANVLLLVKVTVMDALDLVKVDVQEGVLVDVLETVLQTVNKQQVMIH